MARTIVDPRFAEQMSDFFPSTCEIQEDLGTENDYGEIVHDWQPLTGHTAIACSHGPSKGKEVKQPDQTYVVSNYTIELQGQYLGINEAMRAVVDGIAYDILLVQASSHGRLTRILARKVT